MEWQELEKMAQGKKIVVSRVELEDGIAIEGKFELPPLAKLSSDDQLFMATFVSVHGSIKEMERILGVSYPTIKARLKKLETALQGFSVDRKELVLDRLASREISVDEAVEELEQCSR